MDKVRVGLVGYGRFGKVHASAISSVPDAELSCVCVSSKERAEGLKKSLAVDVYGDYTEFLEKGKMDVVDIVSPNYLHANQAIKAMQSGRDILLEKPIAISMDEAMQTMEEQKKSSRVIHVGLEGRYTPFMKTFKTSLEDGALVNPAFAKIESWRLPFRSGAGGWRYDGAKVGHQLLEEAIHFFDAAAWFQTMEEAQSVGVEMRDFIERLRAGNEPYVRLDDGVRALSLDLAATSAIGSGSRVKPSSR